MMEEVVSDKQQKKAQAQRLNQLISEAGLAEKCYANASGVYGYEDDEEIYVHVNNWEGYEKADIIASTENGTICVDEEELYGVMKQFGNEFGYKTLIKDWPGAGDAVPKPKNRKPMTETTRTRYEMVGSKKQ